MPRIPLRSQATEEAAVARDSRALGDVFDAIAEPAHRFNQLSGVALSVTGGAVRFSGGGTASLSSLAITSGTVDLDASGVSISYNSGKDPSDSLRQYVQGRTLYSSSDPSVGYGDGADGVVPGLSPGTVIAKPTLAGDVNLDG